MIELVVVRPVAKIATGCVEVFCVRIDGISTINDRKPCMTNRKPITSKSVPVHEPTKLDAATLSNMAHQPEPSGVHDDDALQRIADMLAKLSPSNLQMVKNIIRAIVDQQTPEN